MYLRGFQMANASFPSLMKMNYLSRMRFSRGLSSASAALTAKSAVPADKSRLVPKPSDLIKWVRSEGGFVHPCIFVTPGSDYGLGVIASGAIPAGTPLIELPHHLPLTLSDSSPSSPVFTNLLNLIPEELWAMKLGLKLLQERAKVGSFWWPYISNLPETYSVPIFFQEEDIKNLQFEPLIYQVNKRCRFLLEFEKQLKHAVTNLKPMDHPFASQDVDASSLGWAMSAVSSRAFRLHGKKLDGGNRENVPMMLPLIDMCNHSFDANAKIVQDAEDPKMLVKVVAEKDIEQYAAVELNYGCLSNEFFLLDYGFVIPDNPHDFVELKYDGALLDAASTAAGSPSPYFSSPAPWQREILSALNLDGEAPDLKVTFGGPELVDDRLLAAIRVLQTEDEESVRKHDLSTLGSFFAEAPLGIPTELNVLKTVAGICVIVNGHFPTKVMEDEALLEKGVSSCSEMAIKFRIQKKLTLARLLLVVTKQLRLLRSKQSATAS